MIRHNSLVLTHDDLAAAVRVLEQYDEFAIDTETVPTPRDDGELVDKDALDTRRNRVIWVSLGAPGFGCSIPIGHPNGDVILPKRTVKVYEPTGEKLKSGDEKLKARSETRPPVFDTPPKQLQRTAVFQTLKPLLWSDRRKVGHNIKFDMKSIAKYYNGSIPPGPYGDTAAAFRLVDDNYPTDRLKPVLKKIFGYVYEQFGKRITEASIFDGGTYAYNDAYYTWLLWDWCVRLIDALGLRAVLDLDMDCLPVLAKAEYRGIRIDTDQLQALNLRLDQEIDAALVQLYTDAGRKQWNPNADAEVAWFVYEHCNNPVTVRTKKTQAPSTAKGTIEKIAAKDERVQHILDYRELDKMRGTYVRAIAERLNNGIIGTSFKIAGAATGRLSSTQPNLQNVPTPDDDPRGLGTVIRGMFIPRDGHRFVVCDYSAIEYRVMADMSGDKEYARMFESGEDPHVETAATLFGVESADVSKKQRGIAKNTGFALAYGAGVDKVASMSGVGVDEAQRVMDIHQATFPGLYEWIEDVKAAARQMRYPYFSTALGRRRRLPDLRFGDQWQRWRAERQGVNHVVQGTAAEIMKAALVNLGDMLESDMHLLLTVHDEVVVEAKTDCVDDCAKIVQKAMAGPEMQTLSVPLVAVPAIVDRWSDAK